MTRINVVTPKVLTDQHLIAEYRELPMVGASLLRSIKSKQGLRLLPGEYTLNKGHVTFFYDKGGFLFNRYHLLIDEMKSRGFNPDPDRRCDFSPYIIHGLYNDWAPDDNSYGINATRLLEKVRMKPEWYRYMSEAIDDQYYSRLNEYIG